MNRLSEYTKKPEYHFFVDHPQLQNIIYLTLSGSRGYGTDNADSDYDLRGALSEDKNSLFGLDSFEQFEDPATDTVIYGLKKFVTLCAHGNPNTLELLGTDEQQIVVMTPAGRLLRDHAELFLSKEVTQSFGNYATAQLRRLSNALCHDQYDELKQELHMKNSLEAQLNHFERTYSHFDRGSIRLHVDEAAANPQLMVDITLKDFPLREFTGIYSEMSNTIKTYNKLNHRNRKKDDKHLYKHAMHLIRLLITGTDILNGKGIITRRTAEHELLMDIRNGRLTFSDIFELAEQKQKIFLQAAAGSQLPDKPDLARINQLLIQIYENTL